MLGYWEKHLEATPILQALILADHVYTDSQTGKKVVAGTFNQIWSPQFPGQFGQTTWVYASLTDVLGTAKISIKYADMQNNVLLEMVPIELKSDDPLKTFELVLPVPGFPMPHEGTYRFELFANDDLLGSLRISACKLPEEKST